ncbi:MAG: iron complex transport system substrate-binding protein [Lentisphaeria bacterium]|jgi:iron complex transport system substrate-binding protein
MKYTIFLSTLFIHALLIPSVCWADYRVSDYLGRELVLQKPAERVIALAPHIVENMYAAGAGDTLVGVVDYSDFPEQARLLPKVGIISAFSVETIVALKPDLVIVWYSGRGALVLDQLERLGLTTYASDPRTLKDISRSIRDYGILTANEGAADKSASDYDTRLATLKRQYENSPTVSVLYQIWNDPLQTLNGEHIVSDVIEVCGGRNIFFDAPTIAPRISLETVIQRNPEVILASGIGAERPPWLDHWKRFASLNAVASDSLYNVPPDIIQRHTPRILEGIQRICEQLENARGKRKHGSLN